MTDTKQLSNAIIEYLRVREQLHLLSAVIEELQKQVGVQQHQLVIESAVELSDQELQTVTELVAKRIGYSPSFKQKVDTALLGGVKLKLGDRVIDLTLKQRLEKFKKGR